MWAKWKTELRKKEMIRAIHDLERFQTSEETEKGQGPTRNG